VGDDMDGTVLIAGIAIGGGLVFAVLFLAWRYIPRPPATPRAARISELRKQLEQADFDLKNAAQRWVAYRDQLRAEGVELSKHKHEG